MDCGSSCGFDVVGVDAERVVSGDDLPGSGFGEECGWCFDRFCERVSDNVDGCCDRTDVACRVFGDVDVVDVVVGFAVV